MALAFYSRRLDTSLTASPKRVAAKSVLATAPSCSNHIEYRNGSSVVGKRCRPGARGELGFVAIPALLRTAFGAGPLHPGPCRC